MPARRFMMFVKESSYGVPKTSPVPGVDKFYLRMGDGTDIQDDPIIQETPYGGGRTTSACAWSDQRTHTGTIATLLYPSQAPLLLNWWLTNVNSGRTLPWATTDPDGDSPPNDLGSVSIYEAVQELDGTYTRVARRGCKVNSGTLSAGADGASRAWQLSLNVQAGALVTGVNTTEFPDPAESDYPCGPYLFSHLAGKLKIGVQRKMFDSVTFSADNKLDVKYFESTTPSSIRTYGRDTTLGLSLVRRKTPDDLEAFKQVLAHDAELTLDDGEKFVKIDLHDNNHWQELSKQYPDGSLYMLGATLKNKWSTTQATDLTVTTGDVEEEEEE